jgi:PAS domain S-box-containing protein
MTVQRPQARRPYSWLTPLIILVAVVALVIGTIAVHYVETQLVATTGESLALTSSDIADMLDRILFERYSDIQMLSQAGVFQGRDRTAMTEYFATLKKIYPVYLWLGATDANGRIIASTDPASVGRDRSGSEWYRAVRDRRGIHVQDAQVFEDTGNALAVAFSAPIHGPRGEFQGVVTSRVGIPPLVDVFAKALRAFQVQRVSEGKLEYQFLTRDGDVIADSILRQEGRVNLKHLGLLSALLIGSAQPGYVEEMHLRRRTPVITGYAQTRGYGQFTGLHWGVLVRMDRSDILAPIHAILWKLGLIGAFLFIPLLAFLLWTTGRLRNQWEQAHLRDRAIAAAENGIFITDPTQPTNPVIYVNPALERLTGYGKEEILGRSYRFLFSPDTDATASEEIRMALREERECRVAMKNYRKDGTPFWSEMTMSPVRDPRGRLTHCVGVVTDITELNQATDMLRESERRYAQILDSIADMILCKGPQSQILYANKAFRDYYGMTMDQLRGIIDAPFNQQDYTHRYLQDDDQVFRSGKPLNIPEEPVTQHDGQVFLFNTVKSPIFNAAGEVVQLVAVCRDITKRKRAEEALRESEGRLVQFIEALPVAVFVLDAGGRPCYANQTAQRLLGQGIIPEAQPDQLATIYHAYVAGTDQEYPTARLPVVRALAGETLMVDDMEIRQDGKTIALEVSAAPIFDAQGKIVFAIAAFTDITERKGAEEALRASEERFRQMAENIKEVFWMSSPDKNHMIYISPGYEEIWGRTCTSLYERPLSWLDAIHPEDRERVIGALESQIKGEYDEEYRLVRPDGSVRWIRDRAFPIRNDSGEVYRIVGIAEEITERKQEAATRARLLEQVISAQEEERGRVARELHDETGQSLTALLVGLRTVEDARTIKEAQSQARELRQIAAKTLDEVGRLAWGLRPRVLDDLGLAAVLERYGAEFSASRGIAVNVHVKGLDASRLPFPVETALYRIAQEALTNTAKHAKAEAVAILVEHHTTFVQMMVEDDGCGFDVDATLRATGASKHLGLHGMHERAALLKGTIRIESRPGKGTLINVQIPLSTE